jgi:hypothetical protein
LPVAMVCNPNRISRIVTEFVHIDIRGCRSSPESGAFLNVRELCVFSSHSHEDDVARLKLCAAHRRRFCAPRWRARSSSSLNRSAYRLNMVAVLWPVTLMQSPSELPGFPTS